MPMNEEQPTDWGEVIKSLGSREGWTKQRDWLGPDTQYALAGIAKALNPQGVTGNVGEMLQKYIQGIAARKAFNERMLGDKEFMKSLPGMIANWGKINSVKPSELSTEGTQSFDWLRGTYGR